jgi:hypothetical protein
MGRCMPIPVNTTTCQHTHTLACTRLVPHLLIADCDVDSGCLYSAALIVNLMGLAISCSDPLQAYRRLFNQWPPQHTLPRLVSAAP